MKTLQNLLLAVVFTLLAATIYSCSAMKDLENQVRGETTYKVEDGKKPSAETMHRTGGKDLSADETYHLNVVENQMEKNNSGTPLNSDTSGSVVLLNKKIEKNPPMIDKNGKLLGWIVNKTQHSYDVKIYYHNKVVYFKSLEKFSHKKLYLNTGEYKLETSDGISELNVVLSDEPNSGCDAIENGEKFELNGYWIIKSDYTWK